MVVQRKLSPVYCIDASALINLKRYRNDIFPTIWKIIEGMAENGLLISHVEVYREISAGKDEIFKWCKKNKKIFKDIDDCQKKEFRKVGSKYDKHYWNVETNKPGPWADPWIIALAICECGIIVTDESNKPNKIPAIAETLNMNSFGLLDFFKAIGVKY